MHKQLKTQNPKSYFENLKPRTMRQFRMLVAARKIIQWHKLKRTLFPSTRRPLLRNLKIKIFYHTQVIVFCFYFVFFTWSIATIFTLRSYMFHEVLQVLINKNIILHFVGVVVDFRKLYINHVLVQQTNNKNNKRIEIKYTKKICREKRCWLYNVWKLNILQMEVLRYGWNA